MPQLDRLGLRENPFKKSRDHRYFYADQNRAQILESAEHLIEFSSNFQVIIGESGVGKSHLLEALANRIDNNWRIAKVKNAEQYDTLSLIQALLDAFGAIHGSQSELLEALETQLAEINQLGFKPVLLVDSEQALSIDSLRFLIQLSQQQHNEEPYINIVLFATAEITELLQSSELRDFREIVHIATLNRFDKEGVSGYLRHKMAVAGYVRESPFTPRIIESIFNNSKGLPEKINFFADKFLSSSGKAENYIEPTADNKTIKMDKSSTTADLNKQMNDFAATRENDDYHQEQNDNFMDTLNDDELQTHRSDRAEEQLSRLAEKFEEIEQLGEQPDDSLFTDRDQDSGDRESRDFTYDDESSSSALPKFIIPLAVIGILLVAVIVINSVFEKSEQADPQLADKEKIELLPLELPPQDSVSNESKRDIENTKKTVQSVNNTQPEDQITIAAPINIEQKKTQEIEIKSDIMTESVVTKQDVVTKQKVVTELEVVERVDPDSAIKETPQPVDKESVSQQATHQETLVPDVDKTPDSAPVAGLKRVEPEPVIGSNSRQYITVLGNNLEKDTVLIVNWADNRKEFSAKQTPEQWQYINKNKIKLHLSTGVQSQQWQVSAKNAEGVQSKSISFDVIRPFIATMSIQRILPDPFVGSDKRQAVTVMGEGFSKQTVLELKWDKNKKYFSSRLTPSQFEYISTTQIRLFIATGTKERKWRVLATNPAGNTSAFSFTVVKNVAEDVSEEKVKNNKQTVSLADSALKNENWLKQQPDTNYTIQLFASHNKQAIDDLVKKYSLKGDILRFETLRDGTSWFTMTYGNYASKQAAIIALASLDSELTNPTPWVRSMLSIKEKLKSDKIPSNALSKPKDEAWIWTQNPADYTVQIIALSSEKAIKDYIKQFKIQSESVYFKTLQNGKALYVLLYGNYSDKQSAVQAGEKLAGKISGIKPWVRNFSTVQGMMDGR